MDLFTCKLQACAALILWSANSFCLIALFCERVIGGKSVMSDSAFGLEAAVETKSKKQNEWHDLYN